MNHLVVDPVLPQWAIALLLALGALGVWLSLRRCALGPRPFAWLLSLRLAALALLAALLFQPELLRRRTRVEPPVLAVLVDSSASMLDSPTPRRDERRLEVQQFLQGRDFERLRARWRLRGFEFGAAVDELPADKLADLQYNAPRSHVANAVNEVARRLRGSNAAAILLFSDGLDQLPARLSPEAARLPLYAFELEPPWQEPQAAGPGDTAIADVEAPSLLVVNWKGQVKVQVRRDHGDGRLVCPVSLYRGEERVRQAFATLEPGQLGQQVDFAIEPSQVGRQEYRVVIEPPQDRNPANNERRFVVDVTDPQNRLLYLEGTPRYEFKFAKRALLREKNYELSAFVQSAPGVFVNFTANAASAAVGGLPALTDKDTTLYRAIVLGEMPAAAFTPAQQEALAAYVDKGGGLLFMGGRVAYGPDGWASSPVLAKLLPCDNQPGARMLDGRFSVLPSELGRGHPILRGLEGSELPEVLSLWGPVQPRGGAVPVLAAPDGSPLLLASRYGNGKVAMLLSDSLWRWQLGAPGQGEAASPYELFLSQLVHWLAPQEKNVAEGKALQVLTAKGEAEIRQPVAVGALLGENAAKDKAAPRLTATITTPDGRVFQQALVPARLAADVGLPKPLEGWRTEFVPHVPGNYQIVVRQQGGEQAEAKVLVVEPRLEQTGRPLDRACLQGLARDSGGQWVPQGRADSVLASLPFKPLVSESTEETPLWNQPVLLVLLLALFCLEWYLRSKLDLV